jgi:TolA-binding protein|tara:strand:- start:2270 stop:3400 length:1131 start_codon:yes stop_codon:yes gene_type:complete
MATGSDTRMYSPRSESNLGYSKDQENYRHGYGDPEQMELARDKKQKEAEQETLVDSLPHLQIEVPESEPDMPMPMMEEEEEDPLMMDDQFNEGQQFGAMTGMPDTGNLSIGNATGTMPAPGGMLTTGEPMDDAWSSLMKARLDKVKGAEDKSWKQTQFETQPGGADISTGTSRRAKLQSRFLQPAKKRGLDKSPLSVHRTHLGIATKQPLRLFPEKYGHQMATQARRKLMGNIPQTPAAHGFGPEISYNPRAPKSAPSGGLPLTEPRVPTLRGQSLSKSVDLLKEDVEEVQKKMDYLHFAQIRRLLRQLKDAAERQERRLKAANSGGHGNNREAGHREGQDSTTKPEGATENLEDDPKNWGAPSLLFQAKGSGRVG